MVPLSVPTPIIVPLTISRLPLFLMAFVLLLDVSVYSPKSNMMFCLLLIVIASVVSASRRIVFVGWSSWSEVSAAGCSLICWLSIVGIELFLVDFG